MLSSNAVTRRIGEAISPLVRRRFSLTILSVAVIFIAVRSTLPFGAFWITDTGNRFIQVQSILRAGYQNVAIDYPAAAIDPSLKFFPTAGNHFVRLGPAYYSIVPPLFPLLSTPLYHAFGLPGLYFLPLASGIGLLVVVRAMTGGLQLPQDGVVAALIAALGTPIFFYSLVFWEHTLAALLSGIAVVFLVRPLGSRTWPGAVAAGLLLALAAMLREEAYLLLFAVAVASAKTARRWASMALILGSAALVLVPFWLVQLMVYGEAAGIHLTMHLGPQTFGFAERIGRNLVYFLFRFHEHDGVAGLLALPFALALLLGSFRRPAPELWVSLLALCAAASVAALLLLVTHDDPIGHTSSTQGLFLSVPLLTPLLIRWRQVMLAGGVREFLAILVGSYIALLPLVLHVNWSGIVWGPRYFLLILPVAVALLPALARDLVRDCNGSPRRLVVIASLAGLVITSVGIQVFGLGLLSRKLERSSELAQVLAKTPEEVIVTDTFWVPEEMASLFYRKKFMMPGSDRGFAELLNLLQHHGISRFLFVSSPTYGGHSPAVARLMSRIAWSRIHFDPDGVLLLELDIFRCDISRPPSTP